MEMSKDSNVPLILAVFNLFLTLEVPASAQMDLVDFLILFINLAKYGYIQ